MAHSHAEVLSLQRPQCGASFTAEIGLSGDEDKLREAPADAVPPAGPEVLGTSVQEVNSELTGRAGAELVTLEAAMAVAAVGADKRGGKRRLAPVVMLGLLGASLLAACAPLGPQTVEPGVTIVPTAAATEVQGVVVIVSTEEPTETPTEVPTETPEPTPEPTATPTPTETPDPAVVEAQRVAEYVAENSERINRVEMDRLEFRASDRLQEAIWERLPDDVQALGDKPLYIIVPFEQELMDVIGSQKIFVAGHEDKVPLADKKVVFTFLSGDEEVPEVFMPFYAGNQDGFRYGAFEGKDGEINIVIELPNGMSTFYKYEQSSEGQIVSDGVSLGLSKLSGYHDRDIAAFTKRFYIDTPYDDGHPDYAKGMTWILESAAGNPRRGFNTGYLNSDYYRKIAGEGWIPEEYLSLVLPNG